MLYAGGYARALKAVYICGSEFTGKAGILRHIFEIAAAKRASLHIDAGSEYHLYIVSLCFITESLRSFIDKLPVPACCDRTLCGKAYGIDRVVDGCMDIVDLLSESVRAVAHPLLGNTLLRELGCLPASHSGCKVCLLLKGKSRTDLSDLLNGQVLHFLCCHKHSPCD